MGLSKKNIFRGGLLSVGQLGVSRREKMIFVPKLRVTVSAYGGHMR
jgi:hypothetical protein